MIVCQCGVVSDRAIKRVLEAGVGSVAEACRSTGAAQQCGASVFAVKRVVCEHRPLITEALVEVDVAAS